MCVCVCVHASVLYFKVYMYSMDISECLFVIIIKREQKDVLQTFYEQLYGLTDVLITHFGVFDSLRY